jgi:hypothetical protein
MIIFDLDDEVLDAAESQNVARFLIYRENYLVGSPRVRARWNSPSKPSNCFWTSLDALLWESDAARLHWRQRTAQSRRFTYPSTPLRIWICSPWEFLSSSGPYFRPQSPEILFWSLRYQRPTCHMTINIHWVLQVVLLDLELVVDALVIVKGVRIFWPRWNFQLNTINCNQPIY